MDPEGDSAKPSPARKPTNELGSSQQKEVTGQASQVMVKTGSGEQQSADPSKSIHSGTSSGFALNSFYSCQEEEARDARNNPPYVEPGWVVIRRGGPGWQASLHCGRQNEKGGKTC